MKPQILAAGCAVLLAACTQTSLPAVSRLAEPNSSSISLPDPETGVCLAKDVTPAVIQTVTEQVLMQPAQVSTDGAVTYPATYRTETRQVIVKERKDLTFEALCEAKLTREFVANLQRALAVRGFYKGQATGELNWRTRRAVRLYQIDQGIDSAIISKDTARALGLIAFENFDRG